MNIAKYAALAIATGGLAVAVPASAAVPVGTAGHQSAAETATGITVLEHGRGHHKRKHRHRHRDRDYRDYRDYRDDYRSSYRGDRPYYMRYSNNYGEPVYRDTRVWRDGDRYYCRRRDGTTGLLVGAGVGVLLGREVAGRGDRTLGAVIGGVAGALLGRQIDRGSTRCG